MLVSGGALAEPQAEWPFQGAPRDPDGRFRNPVRVVRTGSFMDAAPFLVQRIMGRGEASRRLPKRVEPDIEALHRASTNPSVTWVGHATLLVRMDGMNFLTDPTWADWAGPTRFISARRYIDPGVPIEDLPRIDFVVVSHNHYDHMDLPTLRRLADDHPEARFLVPLGNGDLLRGEGIENVIELDWGERHELGSVTIYCLPAQHWSRRGLFDERKALWSSWAVIGPERRFYFGGDTAESAGFRLIGETLGPFDLAALPIGAYEPQVIMRPHHLDPEQAVQAALELSAHRVMGIHFGTFDLAAEPLDEPPRRFRSAARAADFDHDDAWILKIGETRPF
jgi:N-acyl-phosphatidylethanolamine-hydrolysing phospholipase D